MHQRAQQGWEEEEEEEEEWSTASDCLDASLAALVAALDAQTRWVHCLGTDLAQVHRNEVAALLLRRLPEELPRLLREHYREMIDASIEEDGEDNDECRVAGENAATMGLAEHTT